MDFEIKRAAKDGGDPRTVEVLFERCLIACALYEEFWSKYADYLESRKMEEKEKDDEKVGLGLNCSGFGKFRFNS